MMGKILPLLLALGGLGGGIGAGYFLRPQGDPSTEESHQPSTEADDGHADTADSEDHDPTDAEGQEEGGPEYVKLNNQFVVPVMEEGRVAAMVVLALSLEVETGNSEAVYLREPKLRDVLLQVMFDHANVGGFSGSFTDASNLVVLRTSLKEAAAMVLGTMVRDVLITDIARQDS